VTKTQEITSGSEKDVYHFNEYIWTAFPPSTGLPVRLAQNLNRQKPEKRKTKKKGKMKDNSFR